MPELVYHPIIGDADRFLAEHDPTALLVIGDADFDAFMHVECVRWLRTSTPSLPIGLYCFLAADGPAVLIVKVGTAPGPPMGTDWGAADDHPLVAASDWFSAWWDDAATVPRPRFALRDEVVLENSKEEGIVRTREFHPSGMWWYRVRAGGRALEVPESGLGSPADDDDPFEWVQREPRPAAALAATLTRAKLREHLSDTVYSFRATRTLFRPYQFRPVIRLLSADRLRLLIADEVGLGKTIEAGLVWTELDARQQADRVLVVCPSMLVSKWRAEMEERFGYDVTELDRLRLAELLEKVEADRLPARLHAICSVERLRVWDGLERMAALSPRFDLIIADEAHVFRNSETKSHALGVLLADWADALVLLSATPLNLGNEDLYNLLQLLSPGEFDDRAVLEARLEPNRILHRVASSLLNRATTNDDRLRWLGELDDMTFGPAVTARPEFGALQRLLRRPDLDPAGVAEAKRLIADLHTLSAVITRTRKIEIQERKAVREARPIAVNWTGAEADLYSRIERWQKERARALGLPVGFVTQMPLRLASTCLPAARDRVLAQDAAAWVADSMEVDDDGTDAGTPADEPPPPDVVDAARRLGSVDTKFDMFVDALAPVVAQGRRVLVFTFSRAALAYLERRLKGRFRVGVLHGDIDTTTRHDTMRRFRAHEFDVLLASRVASEGLDFEFASVVVNYDLPWNPMEVEQRIGRIDRFGQEEDKLLIFNFITPGTIESDIILRVLTRIGVFHDSIGELEPIIQSQLPALRRTALDFNLSPEQREQQLDAQLAAIEAQRHALHQVEDASGVLASTDRAEIEGLEGDLVASGRYVGQQELALVVTDWVARSPGGRADVSSDSQTLFIRGTSELGDQLRAVQAKGERSAHEVEDFAKQLRNEAEISISLDQELARVTGRSLLSATHPLVRAAVHAGRGLPVRFASLTFSGPRELAGDHLVLLALARWIGVRPTTELWTESTSLNGGEEGDLGVGAALLAALATGTLSDAPLTAPTDVERILRYTLGQMRDRQLHETTRRKAENEAIVETRRISLQETHARKVNQIRQRIATLRARGNTNVIRLHESQLANQDRRLRDAQAKLEATRHGSMDVEHLGICLVRLASQ